MLWVITLNLLILNLGCNKLWSLPLPNDTVPPQSQPQPQNEPNATKAPQGLIGLPLPLSPFSNPKPRQQILLRLSGSLLTLLMKTVAKRALTW